MENLTAGAYRLIPINTTPTAIITAPTNFCLACRSPSSTTPRKAENTMLT